MSPVTSINSSLRVAGLATGLDTESIVKELMKVERARLDKLYQQKQILEWQQEDYRAIYAALRSFRDKVFAMKLQATYLAKKAVSSNEAVVAASASTKAVQGVYPVIVTNLAQGVFKQSQSQLPEETGDGGAVKTLAQQFQEKNLPGELSFTIEGQNGSAPITINTATDTIYTLASKINAAGVGISAIYDAALNRFFLVTTSTGSAAKIKISGTNADFFNAVLDLGLTPKTGENGTHYEDIGMDAKFKLGGDTAPEITSQSNTVTVAGITLNLKQAGTATITVSADTDAVFNAIKDFVNAYNELIGKINAELTEPRYRDYLPLTDEQREQLSDEQEKKWEEKARSGLLQGDSLLQGILYRMRASTSAVVPGLTGRYDTLADIGITTGSYAERGKLYIDEAKLKEALSKDPEGVMNLFTKSATAYAEKGIAVRLYDDVDNALKMLYAKAGSDTSFSTVDNSAIGRELARLNERIASWEERLQQIEDRYWRQFTALEEAIARMNAQSAWLAQQFSSMSPRR